MGSADIKNVFHQLRIPEWLQAFSALLASEVSYTGKTSDQKRLARESLMYPVPTTLPMGSMCFCQDAAGPLGVVASGANCTDVHLARLIAGIQKVGLDVHDITLASGSADVLGYEVSPANSDCSGKGKRIARIRSVVRTVSSRRRISGSSFVVTGLFWRSPVAELSQFLTQTSCLLRSDWCLRWLDVYICTDASEKLFAFAVREGCRELASEVGRFSERAKFKVTCASHHRAGSRIGVFKFGRSSRVACPEREFRGLP